MSIFVYSTETSLDGPWLIDRNALKQLGDTIDAISLKFENANTEFIERKLAQFSENFTAEKRLQYEDETRATLQQRHRFEKTISLSLTPSKLVEEQSIERLLSSPDLLDESPTGLSISIKTDQRSVKLILRNSTLRISTSPETDELSREAFVELQQWALVNQAPLWQRLWKAYYPLGFFVCMLVVLFSTSLIPSREADIKQSLKPTAIQLLKDGISNQEMPAAIEILLRNEFKEPIAEPKAEVPGWYKVLSYGSLAFITILFFRPPLLIGIGRNVTRINRWRNWMRFVGVTLPGLIVVSVAWPYLLTILGLPH